ncbi:hypothetical protein AYK26_05830 [Euryarchaeota archaeon SM23-78]|nr:MAG: hypothetical protein AYK26_05830 [Euryarchaeota archaeon SM23-78]
MQASILLNNRISEIKKRIHLLEWDISVIEDNDLRFQKQKQLVECRKNLEKLEGLFQKRVVNIPQKELRR